jgi:hypothetical protein
MKTDIVFQWSRRVMFFTALSACKPEKETEEKIIQGKSRNIPKNFSIMPDPDESGSEPGGGGGFHNIASSFQVKSFKIPG